MHMGIAQGQFYARNYRQKAGSQIQHPDQASAFTPTVRTPQCGHTWTKYRREPQTTYSTKNCKPIMSTTKKTRTVFEMRLAVETERKTLSMTATINSCTWDGLKWYKVPNFTLITAMNVFFNLAVHAPVGTCALLRPLIANAASPGLTIETKQAILKPLDGSMYTAWQVRHQEDPIHRLAELWSKHIADSIC